MTEIEQAKADLAFYKQNGFFPGRSPIELFQSLITTIESLQKELETETKDRCDCEKSINMWKKESEHQELLVIKREKDIGSKKDEIEKLKLKISSWHADIYGFNHLSLDCTKRLIAEMESILQEGDK